MLYRTITTGKTVRLPKLKAPLAAYSNNGEVGDCGGGSGGGRSRVWDVGRRMRFVGECVSELDSESGWGRFVIWDAVFGLCLLRMRGDVSGRRV